MKTRSTESKTTTNRREIVQWAKARGGKPARIRGTGKKGKDAGLLRIDFPGGAGRNKLEPISWDKWFEKFKENKLRFLYQENRKAGGGSTFFKLVDGGSATAARKTTVKRRPAKKSAAKRSAATRTRSTGTRSRKTAAQKKRGTAPKRSAARGTKSRAKNVKSRTR